RNDYSTNYINQVMKLLNCIMKAAKVEGVIDRNPCEGVKNLKRTEQEARETIHRALTLEETEEFFRAAKDRNSWYLPLYEFLINTGCRIGEAGALQRSDIDIKNNVIHIRRTITISEVGIEIGESPKTKTSKRDIPMNDAIKTAIQKQEQQNRDLFGDIISLNSHIFSSMNGGFISSTVVIRDIKATLKNTGIDYFTPHAFRDTFATRAIEAGMNPQTLKEILGHSSYSMTMDLYAHVMENTKQKEMNLIRINTGT
ncbi:site-specific recombinase XerD, partial [Lachnospiraceae bacterium JC7]